MPEKRCTDHVFLINLANLVHITIHKLVMKLNYSNPCLQHWCKLKSSPVAKSDHAAVCLGYNSSNPYLFITGGRDTLNDHWMLDLEAEKWEKVRVSQSACNNGNLLYQVEVPGLQARYLHSATAFSLTPGLIDIVIFGGCNELPTVAKKDCDYSKTASTTVLRFGKKHCNYALETDH